MEHNYQYFISQDTKSDNYNVYTFNPDSPSLFKKVKEIKNNMIPKGYHILQVGNYILQWSPLLTDNNYSYRLLEFNPDAKNPLGSYDPEGNWTEKAVQSGTWSKGKFFGSRSDFANADGAQKGFESGTDLVLLSMDNFVLNWIPTEGRGTYQLFNFDHGNSDPLPAKVTPQGAWLTIEDGHQLIPISGYVIDWVPKTGAYEIFQFDAQDKNPLSFPAVRSGNWRRLGIRSKSVLNVIGNQILEWDPSSLKYNLRNFDLSSENVLSDPVKSGKLPKSFTKNTVLTGIETLIPVDAKLKDVPGTMDFFRDKIEHVVYYMIENRSFDHVVGWLYNKNAPIKVIGPEGPYNGVDKKFTNEYQGKQIPITKYNKGRLSMKTADGEPFVLDLDQQDPYHDNSDVLRQMFYDDMNDYYDKKEPDMGGFAWNNGTDEVMLGYSPKQLPILNGLAENFAISDDWFCSMPGGTDVNRAFSVTGSSLGQLNNFQNGVEYTDWFNYPHRPSIWKVLWSNGIQDFKIYNAVEWINCKFTYNLFLKGQIPSIDDPFVIGDYAPQLNQFYDDVKYDTLPKFSFLEPKWVASNGSTSYHPGNDLIPGERTLNDIFNALQDSPVWEKTLFIITFDEHGGLPDHVKPPYATKPWANDSIEGFDFDIMGVRIPTILISPWISKNTVFRSDTGTSYDATSFLASLLHWCGIPKSRWGMGERTNDAPTFENVILEKKPRTDKVELTPPWDSKFPPPAEEGEEPPAVNGDLPVHGLHELVLPRMVADMAPQLSHNEREKVTNDLLSNSRTLQDLHKRLGDLHAKHNGC
ncbi:MAG: alkaline phosphatase family protein [Saprospiraceae bacterium]|nr:alkaline phosphatase family protein [Saprospiraceae bacterium]